MRAIFTTERCRCSWPECPGYPIDVPMHETEQGPELHDECLRVVWVELDKRATREN